MGSKFIFILSVLFFSAIILLIDDYYFLGSVYFYISLAFVAYNIISSREIKLIDVWNVGFVFIILSEVFVSGNIDNSYLASIKFLLIANNIFNIGYKTVNKRKFKPSVILRARSLSVRDSRVITLLLIVFLAFYFMLRIQEALYTFAVGRNVVISEGAGSGFFLGAILNAIGFVLPSIFAYYYIYILKRPVWIPILLSLPIFIILFMAGSRFPLLFSLLGLVIVLQSRNFGKMAPKQYITIIGSVLLLAYTGTLMKHLRSASTRDTTFSIAEETPWKDLPTYAATTIMSPEGVIDMTNLMFDYFSRNNHLYGTSSSFILYFWVPREVWPDKPTMLGHWFIREHRSGFAEGHSASFGFTGDLYADFGLLSLLFVFFLGRMLKYAENFKSVAFKKGGYSLILGAMLFPYVFFFVRSPITATMTFLGIIFFYQMFKRLIFIK